MDQKHPLDMAADKEGIAVPSLECSSKYKDKSTTNESIHNQPSLDGGYGWLVLILSTVIQIILHAVLYSFSVFYIEFTDVFQKSKAEIGILLSLNYFFLFGIGKYNIQMGLFSHVLFYCVYITRGLLYLEILVKLHGVVVTLCKTMACNY